MKNYKIKSSAIVLALGLLLSACGGSDSDDAESSQTAPELESAKQVLYFYGASTNDHYAYNVVTKKLENLNDDNVTAMQTNEKGRLFYWRDDRGDTNASNDVDKVLMFKSSYTFASDGNASWEDFYYLDHLHNADRHPHSNDEFNVTSGGKFDSMIRLNKYLAEQEQLKTNLKNAIVDDGIVGVGQSSQDICNFYTLSHADEKHHFALGTNGYIYTFDDNNGTLNFKDLTDVSSGAGCEVGKSGLVAAEDGVLVYLQNTSTIYLVDSHDDGVSHVHSQWDVSEVVGDGRGVDMIVGIGDLEYESEYGH